MMKNIYISKKENIEEEIWKLFIFIRDIPDVFFWTLKQKLDEAKTLQLKKYYENWIEYSKTEHQELVAFVNSVLYYKKIHWVKILLMI